MSSPASDGNVHFVIGLGIRPPIVPGSYQIQGARVTISYPDQINFGNPGPTILPRGMSCQCVVDIPDKHGRIAAQLLSNTHERHLPIQLALEKISQFLQAFKLPRIGHFDGLGIRTVGIGDTLYFFGGINGKIIPGLNVGFFHDVRDHPWRFVPVGEHPDDPLGTTKIALEHLDGSSFPIARLYVRCFELVEHGFYTEAVILAHARLDDLVQLMIKEHLSKKGLTDNDEQKELLRAIQQNRLAIYLGPLLLLCSDARLSDAWRDAPTALEWLNSLRNRIAHNGATARYEEACIAVFVCLMILSGLDKRGFGDFKFPEGMFRQARIAASWTSNPPKWVPKPIDAEKNPFD